MCVCVCVCVRVCVRVCVYVCVRERKRERDRERGYVASSLDQVLRTSIRMPCSGVCVCVRVFEGERERETVESLLLSLHIDELDQAAVLQFMCECEREREREYVHVCARRRFSAKESTTTKVCVYAWLRENERDVGDMEWLRLVGSLKL